MVKPTMILGLSQEISFAAITWNSESNCTCREKNHFLFRRSTSTLPETFIHHWMYCWRKNIDDYWKVDVEKELLDAWTGFTRFILLNERPLDWYTWSGWDLQGNKQNLVQTMYGQICGSICLMQRSGKHSKSGLSRNRSSKMPEDYVVFSSLKQVMKNLNIPWKTLVESWKLRCQQQCFVDFNLISTGKPVARLDNTRPNMLVLLRPTKLWGQAWKDLITRIMKITSKEIRSIHKSLLLGA